MARYETGARDSTDFFRWRSEWVEDGVECRDFSGEYRTIKNVEAGIRYDQGINKKYYSELEITHKIQKLVAVYAYPPYLEWQDLENIVDY